MYTGEALFVEAGWVAQRQARCVQKMTSDIGLSKVEFLYNVTWGSGPSKLKRAV